MQEESDLQTNLPSAPQPPVNTDQNQGGKIHNALKEDREADGAIERRAGEGRAQKRRNMDSAQIDRYLKRTCRHEDDFGKDSLINLPVVGLPYCTVYAAFTSKPTTDKI